MSIVFTRELDTDVPGCRVCVSVWEISTNISAYNLKNLHNLISCIVLPVSFTMSVNERTYIMIKVAQYIQTSSDC